MALMSQMPVVLLPIHFDRDAAVRTPSCQRSIVLRPFKTHDFMTGVPAIPGKDLPIEVSYFRIKYYFLFKGMFDDFSISTSCSKFIL